MKNIYLTVDVECHDISRRNQYIDGKTSKGEYGLKRILELAKQLDIPVNFFFDMVECHKYGDDYSKEIIDLVKSYNQNVYLHLHPDYVTGDDKRGFLFEYSHDEKKAILQQGFDDYRRFTGKEVKFFRIGRYGADRDMYSALNELGVKVTDLSYCYNNYNMCHITYEELGVKNKLRLYENQLIFPNTRYCGFRIGKIKKDFNLDTSETTYTEWKELLQDNKMSQITFTMHSWNFIKKYFFLSKYVTNNKSMEKKFIKMVNYAKIKGYVFCDLSEKPPVLVDEEDNELDLCKGFLGKIKMIINNYIRFNVIARLNPKYMMVYGVFYCFILFVFICIIKNIFY